MARTKRTDNRGRVLKVGESQDKSGRYAYKWTDTNGKRNTIYSLDLVELREKEKRIQRDLEDGIDSRGGEMALDDLFQMYMSTKTNIRETTKSNYINYWNSAIKQTLGAMQINKIKQIHIKTLYAKLINEGYAPGSIRMFNVLLSATLQMAVDSDLIRKNPCKGSMKGVKKDKTKKTALTIKQQEILLDFVQKSNVYKVYYPIIVFALSTGLRIGEICGLRWEDVDLNGSVIHVRQQLIYKNLGEGQKYYIHPLKTETSKRDIPLTETARKSLIKQRELDFILGRRAKEKSLDGKKNYVFINSVGKQFTPQSLDHPLINIVNTYNKRECVIAEGERREPILLPHITAHILRHTACTRLAEAGIDPKALQVIMGHSDIATTMDIYNHADYERIQNEMKKAENII